MAAGLTEPDHNITGVMSTPELPDMCYGRKAGSGVLQHTRWGSSLSDNGRQENRLFAFFVMLVAGG